MLLLGSFVCGYLHFTHACFIFLPITCNDQGMLYQKNYCVVLAIVYIELKVVLFLLHQYKYTYKQGYV